MKQVSDLFSKCECCGRLYKQTLNKDGSIRKTKRNACSKTCADRLRRGAVIAERKCAYCGSDIDLKYPISKKYCSDACKESARSMRDKKEVESKVCSACNEEKLASFFNKKSASIDGLASVCRLCAAKSAKERYQRRINAGDKVNTPYAEKTEREKEILRRLKRKYRRQAGARPREEINKLAAEQKLSRIAEQNAKQAFDYWTKVRATDEQAARYWAATDEPWRNPRLTDAEQYALRYKLDVRFQLGERMRSQTKKAKKRDGIAETIRSAIRRGGSSRKVEGELGYSIADLMTHIEKQFTKGMNWEKFKAGEIHIDHIMPQASFDLADDDEWRRCWCLSNLRPMWSKENLRKRDAILFLC